MWVPKTALVGSEQWEKVPLFFLNSALCGAEQQGNLGRLMHVAVLLCRCVMVCFLQLSEGCRAECSLVSPGVLWSSLVLSCTVSTVGQEVWRLLSSLSKIISGMATADNKFLKLLGLTGCRSRLLHALPAFSGSYCICSCRLNPALTVAQSCTAFLAALCLQALGTQHSVSASGELVTCVGNERVKNNLIAGLRSVWTCGLLKENAIQHRCTELFHS